MIKDVNTVLQPLRILACRLEKEEIDALAMLNLHKLVIDLLRDPELNKMVKFSCLSILGALTQWEETNTICNVYHMLL